jgi:hypothetical protein
MFCLKAHQLSIVLPSKSRLVQLRIYTNFTMTCFFLGVTCYFSRIPYFWSIVLFRCNDFIRSFILCLNYSKSSNSTTLFCLIYMCILKFNKKISINLLLLYNFMSVVLPFLLRLVRVICLIIFEAKLVFPFAYFLFHHMCRRQKQK